MLDEDRLVGCMSALADRTHSIERRYAESGSEISVGPAARGSLFKLKA